MFDSHAHVTFPQFDADRDDVIDRTKQAGVDGWIEIGTDLDNSRQALELAKKVEGVYASVGVHPNDIYKLNQKVWGELTKLANHPRVKAVGEVGLDFYRGGSVEEQQGVLERFIGLAQERSLPVIFHVRSGHEVDAHDTLLYLLSHHEPSRRPSGVIHTFSGTAEQARKYLEFGLYISFSGVLTFQNAGQLVDVANWVPLDRVLIETDCPFLAPAPFRGKRNEPIMIQHVAEKLAEIKGISVNEVDEQTTQNARELFHLT